MKKQKRNVLVAAIVLTLIVSSCANNSDMSQQAEVKPTPIEVMVVKTNSYDVTRNFSGTLVGEKQAEIHARITEAVQKLWVEEGQKVSAGQVLLTLDKSGPSSSYRNSESIFKNAEKNYKKAKYLYEQGAIPESQYDAAFTEYEVARASFDAVAQLVEIRSPIDGIVTSLNVKTGEYVQIGQKLATIATLENLRVTFNVNAGDIAKIHIGDTVLISSSNTDKTVPGEVIAIAQSADPKTRAFEVEATIANTGTGLHPGMFVRVGIIVKQWKDAIIIPHRSIVVLNDQENVFVVDNGKAVRRPVTVADETPAGVVISSGLNVGDTLVTLGQTYLDNGFAVNVTSMKENRL